MSERQVPHPSPLTPGFPAELLDSLCIPVAETAGAPCFSFLLHPFMGISPRFERGQGCSFLRGDLVTNLLGLRSPIPAQKYIFGR